MKRVFAATAALAALATSAALPASAQNAAALGNPTELVPHLGYSAIDPVIRSVDPSISYRDFRGQKVLRIASNGFVIAAIPNGCDDQGKCPGLILMSVFEDGASAAAYTEYNASTPSARVFQNSDGSTTLFHYIIGDFGVTKGSLLVNIVAFFGSAQKWSQSTSSPDLSNTVSFEPLTGTTDAETAFGEIHLSQDLMEDMLADPSMHTTASDTAADWLNAN